MKILQVLPYFPPHTGGLEQIAEEFSKYFVKYKKGTVMNVIFSVGQTTQQNQYEQNGYQVIVLPAFDIIPNFPVPKIRKSSFRQGIKKAKQFNPDIIQTHTRFFLSTLLGGILSKLWNKKRSHVCHGSAYVQVNNKFTNHIAYLYDRIIGKRVFKKSDLVIPTSKISEQFIVSQFQKPSNIKIIYRGMNISNTLSTVENLHNKFPNKIIVGFLGRLYKWKNIESLIRGYYNLGHETQNTMQIVVVGNGEDLERLRKVDTQNKIYFTGEKSANEALAYQQQFDIHYHTSHPGGALAGTLLQAMHFGIPIIATPNEGALDVLINNTNALVLKDSSLEEIEYGLQQIKNILPNKQIRAEHNQNIIQKQFERNNIIEQYHHLYKNILGRQ